MHKTTCTELITFSYWRTGMLPRMGPGNQESMELWMCRKLDIKMYVGKKRFYVLWVIAGKLQCCANIAGFLCIRPHYVKLQAWGIAIHREQDIQAAYAESHDKHPLCIHTCVQHLCSQITCMNHWITSWQLQSRITCMNYINNKFYELVARRLLFPHINLMKTPYMLNTM